MKNRVIGLFLTFYFLGLFFSFIAEAAKPAIKIAVGKARTQKTRMAYPPLKNIGAGSRKNLDIVRQIIVDDLHFSGLFKFLNSKSFLEDVKKADVKPGTFDFVSWSQIGAQFLVKGEGRTSKGKIEITIYLYSVSTGKVLLKKNYSAKKSVLRKLSHTISNDIFFALTQKRAAFTSKVAFVSDISGKNEIYIMDYDGHNRVQVTNRKALAMSPAWSPDGSELIFSSTTKNKKNVRNQNLFIYNLRTGKIKMLSDRNGLNSGGEYHPNGRKIALTMSFLGNPDIFIIDKNSKEATRITKNYALDVDPSWSPSGREIVFSSNRSGQPMIYKMRSNGTGVSRLTYAGRYNSSPSWSPTGDKIVFAGWDKGKFDLFIMNTDGTNLERLTKKMGSNEDPHFAPDGYFIVYSSNRSGKKNLYITNTDNSVHRRITKNFGNCKDPKWGPAP